MSYPDNVFERWKLRCPEEAAADPDPRSLVPCRGSECQTFAWRGYDGLCGWCEHERLLGGSLTDR